MCNKCTKYNNGYLHNIHHIGNVATGVVRIRQQGGGIAMSQRGVLQGDIFSPVSFIAGDRIFRLYDRANAGMTMGEETTPFACRSLSMQMTLHSSMRTLGKIRRVSHRWPSGLSMMRQWYDGREGPPLYWAKAQGEDAKLL